MLVNYLLNVKKIIQKSIHNLTNFMYVFFEP